MVKLAVTDPNAGYRSANEDDDGCEKCGSIDSVLVQCSCELSFCASCLAKHVKKCTIHNRLSDKYKKAQRWWASVTKSINNYLPTSEDSRKRFMEKDETNKWFGLSVDKSGPVPIARIVETRRFSTLMEDSLHGSPDRPRRQYPSIVSFVGETGVGKSTLIRALLRQATQNETLSIDEGPGVGSSTGSLDSCTATSGEVNLYHDPLTFGSANPILYADCEGLDGGEPVCSKYQKEWYKYGKSYLIEPKDSNGHAMDRKSAVRNLYPRFLYIFSDIVCLVSKNPKIFGTIVTTLMQWSEIGARKSLNQYALPAAIIIINQSTTELPHWTTVDTQLATNEFFILIESELKTNNELKALARKYGDHNIRDLLSRNFSSVHVIYVPLEGYRQCGSAETISLQIERLRDRIRYDTTRVQKRRTQAWTRFDSKTLSILFTYAFEHLAKGNNAPFDFSTCRKQTDGAPTSITEHIARFLSFNPRAEDVDDFKFAAKVIGSCLVRHELRQNGTDLLLHSSVIFNDKIKGYCIKALDEFYERDAECSYVQTGPALKCVNTKVGHVKGHQSADGLQLAPGDFETNRLDIRPEFLEAIRESVQNCLKLLDDDESDEKGARRNLVLNFHREAVQKPREPCFWAKIHSYNTCYGCLCCSPQYILPCGHALCEECVRDFGQRGDHGSSTTLFTHESCLLCGVGDPIIGWPWKIHLKPKSADVRVLSLDGGGVRAIAELEILRRVEKEIGLNVPMTNFFDLIVGTNMGGIIALGIESNKWDLGTCLHKLKNLTKTIFQEMPLAKAWVIGWFFRSFYGSIYNINNLESSLQSMFSSNPFFGISRNDSARNGSSVHHARIAITTTVDSNCRLFTNYQANEQESNLYLDANTKLWEVARCTSAAPMYFTPFSAPLVGAECRDGGLKAVNPIQLAANESKRIWGKVTNIDLLLSIGTGFSESGPDLPSTWNLLPDWVQALFANFMDNLNGETMHREFLKNADESLRTRTRRLNFKFQDPREPALDDVHLLDSIQSEAALHNFGVEPNSSLAGAARILGDNEITDVALRLQASLFFYQPTSILKAAEIYTVNGAIHCRLDTGTDASTTLLARIHGFSFNGQELKIPASAHDAVRENKPFELSHSFTHSAADEEAGQVHIEVMFSNSIRTSISGFPSSVLGMKNRENLS